MHATALQTAKQFFEVYCASYSKGTVDDIGSQDVTGSLRDVCPNRFSYTGFDFVAGKNVDLVLTDPYALPLPDRSVDIVLCSSVFEHAEFFWLLFLEIIRVLRPSGLFYMNAPSNSLFHRYPVDCWRFYPDAGNALVRWAQRNQYDTVLLESFWSRQRGDIWNDFVAVFLKDRKYLDQHPARIAMNKQKDVSNYFITTVAGSQEGPGNLSTWPEDQERLREIGRQSTRK